MGIALAAPCANAAPAPILTVPAPGMKWLSDQVEKNIQEQIALEMKVPITSLQVEIENLTSYPEVGELENSQVRVLGLGTTGSRRLDGLFTLNALIDRPNAQSQEVQLSGIMKVVGPVYVARKNINRGELVSEDALNSVQMPWRVLPTGAGGVPVSDLVGRTSKVMISAGSPVYPDILEQAMAIRSGDLVELTVLSGPGVMIRSRAIARQEGRMGDTIKIEQPDTKKLLIGTVVGQKAVEVQL
jgi:flagella basal body P-ring formation protein FlgA